MDKERLIQAAQPKAPGLFPDDEDSTPAKRKKTQPRKIKKE